MGLSQAKHNMMLFSLYKSNQFLKVEPKSIVWGLAEV